MSEKIYYVYFITNKYNNVIYTGVTNDLKRRIWEHREGKTKGFASRYNCRKLVYFEVFGEINDALIREGKLKRYTRERKDELVNRENPAWEDRWEQIAHWN